MSAIGARLVGQVIKERYQLLRVLGEGGQGVVLEGIFLPTGERCAVKFLRPEAMSQDALTRFRREAGIVTTLQHPGIVRVFGEMEEFDGMFFLVMELLQGENLDDRVKRGPTPWAEAAALILQATEPLIYAHGRGLVHRDIKPENLFFVSGGRVKVLDFGIAKDSNASRKITGEGAIMGTPSYMSREQASGMVLDARSDIYSLGVALYQLVTTRVPFPAEDGNWIGVLGKIMTEPPPDITLFAPDLPPGFVEVVRRAMQPKREDRYPTMQKFADALRICLSTVERTSPEMPTFQPAMSVPTLEDVPQAVPREISKEESSRRVALAPSSPESSRSPFYFLGLGAAVMALGGSIFYVVSKNRDGQAPVVPPGPEIAAPPTEAPPKPVPPVAEKPEVDTPSLPTSPRPEQPPVSAQPPPSTPPSPPAANKPGTLTIRSFPVATVKIDNKTVGETPLQAYSLRPGKHAVELVSGDGRRENRSVMIQAGKSESLKVRFP